MFTIRQTRSRSFDNTINHAKYSFHFQIKKGSIEDGVAVSNQILALENPHPKDVIGTRILLKKNWILNVRC